MKKNISEILKNARTRHNLTQKQMGDLMGVSQQAIAKYENGSIPGGDKVITVWELLFPDLPAPGEQPRQQEAA